MKSPACTSAAGEVEGAVITLKLPHPFDGATSRPHLPANRLEWNDLCVKQPNCLLLTVTLSENKLTHIQIRVTSWGLLFILLIDVLDPSSKESSTTRGGNTLQKRGSITRNDWKYKNVLTVIKRNSSGGNYWPDHRGTWRRWVVAPQRHGTIANHLRQPEVIRPYTQSAWDKGTKGWLSFRSHIDQIHNRQP